MPNKNTKIFSAIKKSRRVPRDFCDSIPNYAGLILIGLNLFHKNFSDFITHFTDVETGFVSAYFHTLEIEVFNLLGIV